MSDRLSRACLSSVAAAVALAGCGLRDPYVNSTTTAGAASASSVPATTPVRVPAATPAPAGTRSVGSGQSRQAALERFATAWVRWTVGAQPREHGVLLADAADPLRSQLDSVKAQIPVGPQGRGTGRYIGAIRRSAAEFVVVTYELPGRGPQAQPTYSVYMARVVHTVAGWKLSAWVPTST